MSHGSTKFFPYQWYLIPLEDNLVTVITLSWIKQKWLISSFINSLRGYQKMNEFLKSVCDSTANLTSHRDRSSSYTILFLHMDFWRLASCICAENLSFNYLIIWRSLQWTTFVKIYHPELLGTQPSFHSTIIQTK